MSGDKTRFCSDRNCSKVMKCKKFLSFRSAAAKTGRGGGVRTREGQTRGFTVASHQFCSSTAKKNGARELTSQTNVNHGGAREGNRDQPAVK